jgi:hypothetical protein
MKSFFLANEKKNNKRVSCPDGAGAAGTGHPDPKYPNGRPCPSETNSMQLCAPA